MFFCSLFLCYSFVNIWSPDQQNQTWRSRTGCRLFTGVVRFISRVDAPTFQLSKSIYAKVKKEKMNIIINANIVCDIDHHECCCCCCCRMSNDMAGLSWLQRQQQKLRERKDSLRRAERNPQEVRLMSELQSSRQFRGQQLLQHQQSTSSTIGGGSVHHRPVDDAGYLSDVTLFSELDMVNTSREGSPDIRSLYATPLHINTAGTYGQYQQVSHGYPFLLVDSHKVVTRNLNRFNFDLNPIFKFVRV